MAAPPNIYTAVAHDLHPKIDAYIKGLSDSGQIDLDSNGWPYLLSDEREGPNHVVAIVRNGQRETFVMNTRRKADPIVSWDEADGYRRTGGKKVITVDTGQEKDRSERRKRPLETYRRLTNQLLEE